MIFSFGKDKRLRKPAAIRRCFEHNRRLTGRFFTIFWSKEPTPPRLCVVVSKKTSKLAVNRNRMRRIVREAFRCFNGGSVSGDLVVLARRSARDATNDELHQCINKLLKKVVSYQEA